MNNVYSVFDEKAVSFMRPFIFTTDGQATRAFSDGVNDSSCHLSKHSEDYSLHCIGTFDEKSGLIVAETPTRLVCRASEFKN